MNGVPELLVLSLLDEREMDGYELVRAIRRSTAGAITLGEGVVYRCLHDLERRGLLRSRRETVRGRSRVYYRLTPKGRRRLARLAGEWRILTVAVDRVLGGGSHALAT